jgi:hypothetical protein
MTDFFNWKVETTVFNWDDGAELFTANFNPHLWCYVYNDGNCSNCIEFIQGFLTHTPWKVRLSVSKVENNSIYLLSLLEQNKFSAVC